MEKKEEKLTTSRSQGEDEDDNARYKRITNADGEYEYIRVKEEPVVKNDNLSGPFFLLIILVGGPVIFFLATLYLWGLICLAMWLFELCVT